MATLDLATWRSRLRRRLRDETRANFPDELLDETASAAMAAIFPGYYRFVYSTPMVTDSAGYTAMPAGTDINHVFDVEETADKGISSSLPWFKRGVELGGLDPATSYVIVSFEPFPAPSATAFAIPERALELALLYAASTAAESMVFEKARWREWEPSDPDRVDENELLNIADIFGRKFNDQMEMGGAMSLPALGVV